MSYWLLAMSYELWATSKAEPSGNLPKLIRTDNTLTRLLNRSSTRQANS